MGMVAVVVRLCNDLQVAAMASGSSKSSWPLSLMPRLVEAGAGETKSSRVAHVSFGLISRASNENPFPCSAVWPHPCTTWQQRLSRNNSIALLPGIDRDIEPDLTCE